MQLSSVIIKTTKCVLFYILFSGGGSSLMSTQAVMAALRTIINEMKKHYGLTKVRMLDVPCGDMQWMNTFLKTRNDIEYTGVDIVPRIIEHHQAVYARHPWTFRHADIVSDPNFVNNYDLILCRYMLQHLENDAVHKVLRKLSANTRHASFLLTTSSSNEQKNIDLDTRVKGRFRYVNLQLPPFRLEPPLCMFRDGFASYHNYMGLWRLPLMTLPESSCNQNTDATVFMSLGIDKLYSCRGQEMPATSRQL